LLVFGESVAVVGDVTESVDLKGHVTHGDSNKAWKHPGDVVGGERQSLEVALGIIGGPGEAFWIAHYIAECSAELGKRLLGNVPNL